MSETETGTDDQSFPSEDSGTPWGSPGGAIKRWIRRHRANDAESESDTDS